MAHRLRPLILAIAGLGGLVVATASATLVERQADLVRTATEVPTPFRLDGLTSVAAGSLVAGAFFALLISTVLTGTGLTGTVLTGAVRAGADRLHRTLAITLAGLTVTMLAVGAFVGQRLGLPAFDPLEPGAHDPVGASRFLLERTWQQSLVPTVATAVLAVATIMLAVWPDPDGPRTDSATGWRRVLPTGLAVLAGAGLWLAVGFGTVARALIRTEEPLDWSGRPVPLAYVELGSDHSHYTALTASIVVGGALCALLLRRSVPRYVPVLIGSGFLAMTVWSFVDALSRLGIHDSPGRGFAPNNLRVAVELAWQVPAFGAGAVLAVALLAAAALRGRYEIRAG